MANTESEFSRLSRSARRAVFGGAKDVNLPDENPRRMLEKNRQRSNQAIESLKKLSAPAKALSESVTKKR